MNVDNYEPSVTLKNKQGGVFVIQRGDVVTISGKHSVSGCDRAFEITGRIDYLEDIKFTIDCSEQYNKDIRTFYYGDINDINLSYSA